MGGADAEGFCGPHTLSFSLSSPYVHTYIHPIFNSQLNGFQQTEFDNPSQIQCESQQSVDPLQSHHVFFLFSLCVWSTFSYIDLFI